jgi:DNA-binding CsgD family transcriptional regulator
MAELVGRVAEVDALGRLITAVRAGESRALVIHGEPGVGKTALLEHLAAHARGCRVARAAGVQSEMELAFAGLHQLCGPHLDHLDRIPEPQRVALAVALGLETGRAPDRFLIGLAVLGLLSEVAGDLPLICVVDDEQWLDRASTQVLTFVARRLGAESLGLVFGARTLSPELAGLPALTIGGLRQEAARALLDSVLTAPLDPRVRDQIVAETRGNPLALLELPRGLTAAELAGGFGLPAAMSLPVRLEESFERRLDALPPDTRRLLLLAAADPVGDPAVVWRAAELLAVTYEAAGPAVDAGLAEFGSRVSFRHPLVRSVTYRAATAQERQVAHRALAEAMDPTVDSDRRAWHRAQAAVGPDEDVARELDLSAGRAGARGGLAAAAAFLERATALTADPARRASRALAAAQAKVQAGAFEAALDLVGTAAAGPLGELDQARLDVLRARLAFVTNRGRDAAPLLLEAAHRLQPVDPGLARATYIDALTAAMFAGRFAAPGGDVLHVARAARAAPRPSRAPRAPDLLLDGLVVYYTQGYAASAPVLQQALKKYGAGMSPAEELRWLWMACVGALHLWDDQRWYELSGRFVDLARKAGSLSELPLALSTRAYILLLMGDVAAATSLVDEVRTVTEATGGNPSPYAALLLAALRGRQEETAALIAATTRDVTRRGEGLGMAVAERVRAVLDNGLGQYPSAMDAVRTTVAWQQDLGAVGWSSVEFIEAAVRSGVPEAAEDIHRWLAESTAASGTDWALGVESRAHALLTDGADAERLYQESIARLARTRIRVDLARARLLYGEWLRRQRRRTEARRQLRTAHEMFEQMGMEAFAERARRELQATGASARRRIVTVHDDLTAQEALVAGLARDGLSNPEIAARLFISTRTVQYHLGKVFAKLGISARNELARALPGRGDPAGNVAGGTG